MISVEVIVDDGVDVAPPFDEEKLRDYAAGVLGACGVENCEVNVVFIDDCTMEELNGKYRSRSGTTDVLSFTLTEEGDSRLEGEGYVSTAQAQMQALEYGVTFDEEIVRLVTHGLLHLSGREHGTEEEYRSMIADTDRFVSGFFAGEE